jgi:DNA-3-methyladenine glycosylase I
MEIVRCWWCGTDEDYVQYHDTEWGFPVTDDHRLFEKICLEGFQSGLSWLTILRKRESFRRAFLGFDFEQVARFGLRDVARLLNDSSIVRHRGKIESAIQNAKQAIRLADEFGSLEAYFWKYEVDPGTRPKEVTREFVMTIRNPAEAVALSKDLKKRGWTFVGPTTVYSFMEAMGLVNDHLSECHSRAAVERARAACVATRFRS